MKNLLLATVLLQAIALPGRGQSVYSENGVTLSYSAKKYNSVVLENTLYDQYEVKFTFTNGSGEYLHQPLSCAIGFSPAAKHPWSDAGMDFVRSGKAHSYVEYTDGTPLPEHLDSPCESHKYGLVTARMILEPGNADECIKYVLVKAGEELAKPYYRVYFGSDYPTIVNGSPDLIDIWLDRAAKNISLKKAPMWPLPFADNPEDVKCGNPKPIGESGGVAMIRDAQNPTGSQELNREQISLVQRHTAACTEARRIQVTSTDGDPSLFSVPDFEQMYNWEQEINLRIQTLELAVAEINSRNAAEERERIAAVEKARARQAKEVERERLAEEERRQEQEQARAAEKAERRKQGMEEFQRAMNKVTDAAQQYQQSRQQNNSRKPSSAYRCDDCPAGTQR